MLGAGAEQSRAGVGWWCAESEVCLRRSVVCRKNQSVRRDPPAATETHPGAGSRANRVARHTVRASALSFLSSVAERAQHGVRHRRRSLVLLRWWKVVGDVVVAAAVRSSAFEMTAVVPTLLQTISYRLPTGEEHAPRIRRQQRDHPRTSCAASMWRTSLWHARHHLDSTASSSHGGCHFTLERFYHNQTGTPGQSVRHAENEDFGRDNQFAASLSNAVLYQQNLKRPSRVEFVLLRHILRPLARLPTYRSARGKRILLSTYFAAIRAATTRQERSRLPVRR